MGTHKNAPKQRTKTISGVWMFGGPRRNERVDMPLVLTLDKSYYEELRRVVGHDETVRQFLSSVMCGHIENWVGPMWEVAEPEIRNRVVAVGAEQRAKEKKAVAMRARA